MKNADINLGLVPQGEEFPLFVREATHQLETYIRASRRLMRRVVLKHWYAQMNLLLRELGGDKERLQCVLDGYTQTGESDVYKPQAFSAESFRKKFLSIESWVFHHRPPSPYQSPKVYEDDASWEADKKK